MNPLNRFFGSEAERGQAASQDAESRISQLEALLAEERKRCTQKDEELLQMQKLMQKLESHIEQQAKDTQVEQDRLNSLEAVLSKKQSEPEGDEKVKRLLLALSEAKKLKEQAEKLASDEVERADRLQKRVSELEAKVSELQGRISQDVSVSADSEELARLRQQVLEEIEKREEVETRERLLRAKMEQSSVAVSPRGAGTEAMLEKLAEKEQCLQEALQKLAILEGGGEVALHGGSSDTAALQFRLNEEEKKRREMESLIADRDGQLKHLRIRMEVEEQERKDRDSQVQAQQNEFQELKREMSEALTKVSAKESQVTELQRQLMEELEQRQAAQKQVADKEKLLRELKDQPMDRLSKQQAVQEQVIEKEREVCNLQQQLADELSRRQAVQYQVIEKDRVICELQSQIAEITQADPLSEGAASLGTIAEDFVNSGKGYQELSPLPTAGSLSVASPQIGHKAMPPWLASPALPAGRPILQNSRGSVPGAAGVAAAPGGSTEAPVFATPGAVHYAGQGLSRSMGHGQHPPHSSHFRMRAYGTSPRLQQMGSTGMSASLQRRLSTGAATFT
eukprot:TRINITY_DN21857_c0_g1_i1.p1 TRINITY_DN21857_c0_g1~~TRINITY_DN21857_c0_g1_i1.p1  ORF type:complete len:567 (-),score=188.70 TRINITY_DN21857_c0_g1_i1:35-1735(-)